MKKVRKLFVVICIIMVFLLASCSESSGSLQGQETEASGETEVTQQTESVQETESSGETDGELADKCTLEVWKRVVSESFICYN